MKKFILIETSEINTCFFVRAVKGLKPNMYVFKTKKQAKDFAKELRQNYLYIYEKSSKENRAKFDLLLSDIDYSNKKTLCGEIIEFI